MNNKKDDSPANGAEVVAVAAAAAASKRTRHVLMAIQVFSILGAAMLFNSFKVNWTDSRLKSLQIGQVLLASRHQPPGSYKTKSKKLLRIPFVPSNDKELTDAACEWVLRCRSDVACDTALKKAGYQEKDAVVTHAAMLVLHRGYSTDSIRKDIESFRIHRFENIMTIPIPLVGLRIDVNGLGILAGLGYAVMLVWLGLSLNRERQNVRYLGAVFGQGAIAVLGMNLLFAPPSLDNNNLTRKWYAEALKHIPVIAIAFPWILFCLICVHDILTIRFALMVNSILTWTSLSLQLCLLAINLALTAWCVWEYRAADFEFTDISGSKEDGEFTK